jgi:tRNA pseudouridine55 synthase
MTRMWDGLLLVDKQTGPTSHDVVQNVRRLTGLRRVGHAGTLDPLASGLLPVLLGRATRLARFLPQSPKRYEGRLRLGVTTETDDVTGTETSRFTGPLPGAPEVAEAAAGLLGSYSQVPPSFSARKVGGKRLYRLARRGIRVEAPPRTVRVARFAVLPGGDEPEDYGFEAEVSGGTYVRALVRDLGARLGCGATMVTLRRTAIAGLFPSPVLRFGTDCSPDRDELENHLIPLEAMPLDAPRLHLITSESVRRFIAGVAQPVAQATIADGFCAVLDAEEHLLGVGELTAGVIQPRVVLAARTT